VHSKDVGIVFTFWFR